MRNLVIFLKREWPLFISIVAQSILITIASVGFNIKWFSDINVWLGEIFWQLFLFELFSVVFRKIKNQHLQGILTILPSIFIAHTITLTFEKEANIFDVLAIIASICLMVYSYFDGIRRGQVQVQREMENLKLQYREVVLNLTDEQRELIHQCKQLEVENPEEFAFIRRFTMEFVDDIIETEKELNNESNDKDKN